MVVERVVGLVKCLNETISVRCSVRHPIPSHDMT